MPRNSQNPKTTEDLRSLARGYTHLSITTLARIVAETKANAGARVAAAGIILDRGWGKAPATLTGADGGPINVIIRQIIDSVDESDTKLIEHEDDKEDDVTS